MAKRQVFYSFHYENDVMRASQIRNIGVIEGNEPASDNEWEEVKRGGDAAIKKWIDENMNYRTCVIVLIGEETASRKWVKYEIEKAWNDGRGLLGIFIHNIKDPRSGKCSKGANPFSDFRVGTVPLTSVVKTYDPDPNDAYGDISKHLEEWIEEAIKIREEYK